MASPVSDTYSAPSGASVWVGRFAGGMLAGAATLGDVTAAGAFGILFSSMSGPATLSDATAAGSLVVPPNIRTALVGDSLTSLSYGQLHPYTWTIGLSNGALKTVANTAVAGEAIADITAHMDNLYTDAAPGLAGLAPLGRVFVRAGTNNFRGGASIGPSSQADYIALFTKVLTYCSEIVVFAVPPIGASGDVAGHGVPSVNAWLSSYCAATPGLFFINDTTTVDDGTGNWLPAYCPADGIHTAGQGAYQMGITGGPLLAAHLGGVYASPISLDPTDVYPTTPQWVTNPLMTGTGGTNSIGTGQVPTGWSISGYGVGYSANSSIVAADAGDANQTPWLRVFPTAMGGNGNLNVGTTLSSAPITLTYPEALDVVSEVRMNALDGTRITGVGAYVYGSNNEALTPGVNLQFDSLLITKQVIARSAVRRSNTRQTHPSASISWSFGTRGAYTGAMGSIDFRCMTIRG